MMSSAMRQLEERHMASKIELMVWSNKMDLLALSNVKGEVTLHRLSWQRVWTLSPPGEDISVNGIAWRPDGQVIAIGYSNGIVLIVDVENKDIVHKNNYSTSENESCSISSICWLEEKSSLTGTNCSNLIQENAADFLPRLPPISRTFGSINEESNENLEDTKKVSCQKELNFLVVGFTSGKLFVTVFGLFECGIIHLPDDLKSNAIPVAVEISADLKNIFVLVSNGNCLKLIVYDSYVLNSYCKEIYALAYKHGQIMSLMDYLDNTMHAVCEAYENILLLDMESKLSHYADSMPEGTVSADFLELLMFGHMTDSLESFLLHDLTDKGIKKLRHSIELSHSNIQKLVLKHVQAVGQSIAFHLSELKGMARYTERFQVLGVDEPMVTKSFSEVGSFLVKANEVLLVIDESMKKYKALFKWLYDVILRISDDRMPDMQVPGINEQDTRFIADYLYNLEGYNAKSSKKHCFLDHLGQYINDEELTHTLSPELNLWEVFLKDNPCIAANQAIIPRHDKLSLTQQHNKLKQVLKDAFSNPQKAIGSKISVASVTNLMGVSCLPKVSITHLFEKDKLILVFLPHLNTTSYVYMDIIVQEGNISKSSIYFKSQDINTGYTVVDLQIYNKDTISVLLQQPGESRNSVFVQMSMRKIQESATPADVENFVDGITLVEPGALRVIENMVACRLAVSGTRRVAVMLSENMHKVRTYEMEVEEDEEEEDMETTRESDSSSLHQSI
ncbi:unnamed protein product [Nezara viridula]|uniref:Anaphase-promoting complex subunit 4 n=1 Tax=Nezara viridula TaxID=85310 RepID=A0A9P0H0K7_NEZVI|nr:unnamed protein product [Nezara viridula]